MAAVVCLLPPLRSSMINLNCGGLFQLKWVFPGVSLGFHGTWSALSWLSGTVNHLGDFPPLCRICTGIGARICAHWIGTEFLRVLMGFSFSHIVVMCLECFVWCFRCVFLLSFFCFLIQNVWNVIAPTHSCCSTQVKCKIDVQCECLFCPFFHCC